MTDCDRIYIRDLQVRCVVGLYDWERTDKQDVLINVAMDVDLRKAGQSDDIADTVNYKAIKKRVIAMVEDSSFSLIESLAERIAELCLDDPGVQRVSVCVDKPGALRFARSVAVEVVRSRKADP